MAHILFPERKEQASLTEHYFEHTRLIWPLAGLTVIIGTLFRPVAFGDHLRVIDNASGIPILVVCTVLTMTRNRIAHQVLVPIVLASVLWDTMTFSHSIG